MAASKEPKPIVIEGHEFGWITDYANQNTPADGPEGSYKYSFGVTAIRPGKRGSLAPAEIFNALSFTDAGNATNTLPRNIASDLNFTSARSAAILGGGTTIAPRVVVYDNTNAEGSKHDISAHAGNNFNTLPNTGFWGEDIVAYPAYADSVGVNKNFYFYSYNDSAQGDIGRLDPTGPTYVDAFMSGGGGSAPAGAANLQAGVPHRMCIGNDRLLYCTNGQYLATYDSTTDQSAASGTFNAQALFLGNNWVAVDVQPGPPGYAVAIAMVKMGANYQSPGYQCEAKVALWDGFSLEFNLVYDVNDWFIGSLKVIDGITWAFTQGLNNTTKAKYLNPFSGHFQTAWEAPTSIVTAAPLPNQVEYFNGAIMFAGDTTANMVFALVPTQTGYALHTPYYLSTGTSTVTKTGFLRNINSNQLYAGVTGGGFNPGGGIMGLYGDGASNNNIVTSLTNGKVQFRSKTYYPGYRATIAKMKAYFWMFDGNTSMSIFILPQKTLYSEDGNGNPAGNVLFSGGTNQGWVINQTNHPNIANTLTASTSEYGGASVLATDISNFWIIIRFTNTSASATPPILDKLEIYLEPVDKP
jgi:hypothetical protein